MPPRKLRREKGQTNLIEIVETTTPVKDSALTTDGISAKKRTPPTTKRPRLKCKQDENMIKDLDESSIMLMEPQQLPHLPPEPALGSSKLTIELIEMEKRLNANMAATLASFIDDRLRAIKHDLDALLEKQKEPDTLFVEMHKLKTEHKNINRKCNAIESENRHLRDRLNGIGNKMLENCVVMHG